MKELLLKVIVSSIIGAVVSAGFLYFAFDQSLRGMETAINAQTGAISENGEWIRSVDGKVSALGTKIDVQTNFLDKRLGEIATGISASSQDTWAKNNMFVGNLRRLHDEIAGSLVTTVQIAEIWSVYVPQDNPDFGRMMTLIDQLKQQEQDFRALKLQLVDYPLGFPPVKGIETP